MNLVGRKDQDPKLHNCEKCSFPIMAYGRMVSIEVEQCYLIYMLYYGTLQKNARMPALYDILCKPVICI